MEVLVALGEADAVSRLARGDDHFPDAELHRRLDHIVGAHHVGGEGHIVRLDQHARDSGEMHDRVRRTGGMAMLKAGESRVGRQRVERLSAVGEVGDQGRHAGQVERLQIDVEHGIAVRDEMRNGVAAGLAGSPSEDNALSGHRLILCDLRWRCLHSASISSPSTGDALRINLKYSRLDAAYSRSYLRPTLGRGSGERLWQNVRAVAATLAGVLLCRLETVAGFPLTAPFRPLMSTVQARLDPGLSKLLTTHLRKNE